MPKAIHSSLLAAGLPEEAHHLSKKSHATQYDTLLAPQCHLQGGRELNDTTRHRYVLLCLHCCQPGPPAPGEEGSFMDAHF